MKTKYVFSIFLSLILFSSCMTCTNVNAQTQVISKPITLDREPHSIGCTIDNAGAKKVTVELSTESAFANLSLLLGDKRLVDNLDIPNTGDHTLNTLVYFDQAGEVNLNLIARTGVVIVKSLIFEDVSGPDFPTFTDITNKIGLKDQPSLKYGGPSIADMDDDGDYDLVLNNHNDAPSKLYWNNGDGTVTKHKKDLARWKKEDLHGSAAGDYDNDGDLDLIIAKGGGSGTNPQPPVLYKNDNGNLILSTGDVGITKGARGRSARWSDLDLDGDLDLVLINAASINGNNEAQHIFYANKGDGTFNQVNVAGLENAPGERLLLTDLNNDYIDDIVLFPPLSVWKGNGDFTFTEVTNEWLPASAKGLGDIMAAVDVDIDNDGDFDLYFSRGKGYLGVATNTYDFDPLAQRVDIRDLGSAGTTSVELTAEDSIVVTDYEPSDFPIFLGKAMGKKQLTSVDETLTVTKELADGWPKTRNRNGLYIGHTGDGKWKVESVRDAFLAWSMHFAFLGVTDISTSWQPANRNVQDVLLRNDNGAFKDVSEEWNIPKGGNHWGVTRGDFNNDGHQDLFVHRFGYYKNRLADNMLLNTGNGSFEISTSHAANNAGSENHGDMGQAFDFDLDGDIDILNGDDEYGVWHLYENGKSDDNNYAIVKVGYSPKSNVDPISADIVLKTKNNTYHRRVGSSGETYSQSLLNMVHFGLGEADSIESITVRWRNGEVASFKNKASNQIFDTDLVDPTNITIVTSTKDVRAGTAIDLEIAVEPSYANRKAVWSSLDESIASVDPESGEVTGHKEGQSTVIVAKSTANGLTDTITVNVVEWYPIAVESVAVSPDSAKLIKGNTISLETTILPEYADNQDLNWTSSNTSVATVDSEGLVTTVGAGKAIITATSEENSSISDSAVIEVRALVSPFISFDNESKYTSSVYKVGDELKVTADYHAGTGNTVIASVHGGIKFWLRELTANWGVVNDYTAVDESALGEESGTSTVSIPLDGVTPTKDLPEGNFYYLFVSFASSNGKSYNKGVWPINIIDRTTGDKVAAQDASKNKNVSETATQNTKKPVRVFKEEWPSIARHTTPEWFRDAKFGIYTCLAPASVATQYRTTEWYGWAMYKTNSTWWTNCPRPDNKNEPSREFKLHREKWGDQNEFGYKDLIMEFKPTKFNAEEWADIFERSGAKFAGPMGTHHDNYMLWDSEVTRWNSMRTAGIDMCGDLEKRGRGYVERFGD